MTSVFRPYRLGLKKVDNIQVITSAIQRQALLFPCNSLCIITFSLFAHFTEMAHVVATGQNEFLRMNKQLPMVVSPASPDRGSFVGCLC